jgi:hypothetical protein
MLLCISGKKWSGKDTVANYLCNYCGFTKAPPFAVFKYAIASWFDWDEQALQAIGNECLKEDLGRHLPVYKETVGDAIWVKVFRNWYAKQDPDECFVVSDFRFPIEAQELAVFDDVIYVQVRREQDTTEDSHQSESYFDELPQDYAIENNGTLEDLYNTVDVLIDTVLCNLELM